MTLSARSMPFEAVPVAVREREPGADRGVDVEPRAAFLRLVGERVERVDRAEVGRARRADDRDHVLVVWLDRVAGRHRAGRVGRDADHRVGAEAEQRRRAADAVVRGRRRRRSASRSAAARRRATFCSGAVAREQQPEQVRRGPAHRHHARAGSPRPWSCASRVTSASSTNVAGRRRVEGVHRLVGHADRELGGRRGDQRRGVEVGDAVRVARAGSRRRGSGARSSRTCVERRAVFGERVERARPWRARRA